MRLILQAEFEGLGLTGRLETQAGLLCYRLEPESLLWEISDFALKVFNGLNEAHISKVNISLSLFFLFLLYQVTMKLELSSKVVQS